MFDTRLTRWITQAVHNSFDDFDVPVLHTPTDRTKYSQCIEVRVHGPNYRRVSGGWKVQVFVNVLVTAIRTSDKYAMERILGLVVNVLGAPIVVRQTGFDSDEDLTTVGCLSPTGDVKIDNQGTFQQSTAMQATAENVFYMDIKE